MRTLVLGLGNTILSDDGVGIHVANHIQQKCFQCDVKEASAAGFRVIDEIIGYDKLILIDSVKTGKAEFGTLHHFDRQEFQNTLHHSSPHDISLFEAFEIMKKENCKLPAEIEIYGIEVKDTFTFSERCTPKIEAKIPNLVKTIIEQQNLK